MANATKDERDEAAAAEVQESVQPNRYVENESHVPNPTDQYGDVLTRGNVDTTRQMETATPIFRQHQAAASGEEVSQDGYFLTAQQIEAARDLNEEGADQEAPAKDEGPVVEEKKANAPATPAAQKSASA
jgi:hypothetical protein